MRPDTTSSMNASAISATIRESRRRRRPALPLDPRPSSFIDGRQVGLRGLKRRSHSEQQAGRDRDDEGEEKDAAVHAALISRGSVNGGSISSIASSGRSRSRVPKHRRTARGRRSRSGIAGSDPSVRRRATRARRPRARARRRAPAPGWRDWRSRSAAGSPVDEISSRRAVRCLPTIRYRRMARR